MTDRMKILQKLEAGEITAEAAMKQLNQENEANAESIGNDINYKNPGDTAFYEGIHKQPPNWIDSLAGWVGEVVDDVKSGINDMEIPVNVSDFVNGTYSHNKKSVTFTHPVAQSIAELTLIGKNDKVVIKGYDGDSVNIYCDYNARRIDSVVQLHEDNGRLAIAYNPVEMRSVGILCEVPRVLISHLHVETKNGGISVSEVDTNAASIITKNAYITLQDFYCKEQLEAHSKNAPIKAERVSASAMTVSTSNGKISAENIRTWSARFITTNAKVKTYGLDVVNLYIKTSNSSIKLDKTLIALDGLIWDEERTIEAITTNSGIVCYMPQGIAVNMDAITFGGRVTSDLADMGIIHESREHLQACNNGYFSSAKKLKLILNTTNASVKIRAK